MADPDPVVAFLAVGERADRLAAEHVDDGRGYCRTCPAGPQKGRTTWPCNLANLAAAARVLVAGRAPDGRLPRAPLPGAPLPGAPAAQKQPRQPGEAG